MPENDSPNLQILVASMDIYYYQCTKIIQSAQFIKSFVRYTWFKSTMISKASLLLHHAYLIIVKVTFSFHEFVSTHQTSIYLIRLSLTYSQFQSPENRVVTIIFDHTHPNVFQSTSTFNESVSTCKKSGFFIVLF